MRTYIDESGTFVTPQQSGHSVCCMSALSIPNSVHDAVLSNYSRVVSGWGLNGLEPKGSSLNERKVDRVLTMLSALTGEIEAYAIYRSRFGDGESAAMAVAVNRRWLIAIDEKGPTRREVIARLGEDHLLTTASILGTAIADGLISANDISGIRDELAANRHLLDHVPGEREEPSSPSRT